MFEYGKKAGYMGIGACVLIGIAFLMVFIAWPELGEQVAMRVGEGGEVTRWGSRWELVAAPVLGLALVVGTFMTAFKLAKKYSDEPAMAEMAFQRYMRNALVQGVVFVVATAFILYGALSGAGIGF